MAMTTQELWAWEDCEPQDESWCPHCKEWVEAESEIDEDGVYTEWCYQCGQADLRDDELLDFFEEENDARSSQPGDVPEPTKGGERARGKGGRNGGGRGD